MKAKNLNIFLSNDHDQNAELEETIKRDHDVGFDNSEIKTSDDWRRRITEGLSESNKILSFLSKHAPVTRAFVVMKLPLPSA